MLNAENMTPKELRALAKQKENAAKPNIKEINRLIDESIEIFQSVSHYKWITNWSDFYSLFIPNGMFIFQIHFDPLNGFTNLTIQLDVKDPLFKEIVDDMEFNYSHDDLPINLPPFIREIVSVCQKAVDKTNSAYELSDSDNVGNLICKKYYENIEKVHKYKQYND